MARLVRGFYGFGMRYALALFAVAVAAAPSMALPATQFERTPAETLTNDSAERWVHFELTPANHIRFAMKIAGRPATALLDTGVSHSMVSTGFARDARLKIERRGTAAALGGEVALGWTRVARLSLGGLHVTERAMALLDLSQVQAGDGRPVDALIGADLLGPHALDIDFEHRRFRLLPTGAEPFAGTRAPLSRNADGLYVTEARLGRETLRAVMIDTGDGTSISVTRDQWRSARLPRRTLTSTISYGLAGPVEAGLTVTDALRLGEATPAESELRIEGQAFADRTGIPSRIGTGFLRRFRVLLDPAAGRLLLEPAGAAAEGPPRSTSGLLLSYDTRRLRVLHVMRGSPAARSGWRKGEQICQVDGAPVREIANGAADLGWAADTPGRTVRLELCDGSQRTLTLARFY
ncbi:aspartyl protease family protein [Sphingomonas sp. PL-96]|uniref:aspartyl protease family protein n=1 Tax=Sphingomonas sp. PL-96 TaxID=2887201 RepID=UPI001E28A5FB|nr:aspartyl protease family protein [Sphingomonas sp. PL-96]MCC2975093.1 aspartyl protease family protein [Sphingomonas sp. PL-96]